MSRLQIRIKATLFSAFQSIHLQAGQALLQRQGCPPCSLQQSTPELHVCLRLSSPTCSLPEFQKLLVEKTS